MLLFPVFQSFAVRGQSIWQGALLGQFCSIFSQKRHAAFGNAHREKLYARDRRNQLGKTEPSHELNSLLSMTTRGGCLDYDSTLGQGEQKGEESSEQCSAVFVPYLDREFGIDSHRNHIEVNSCARRKQRDVLIHEVCDRDLATDNTINSRARQGQDGDKSNDCAVAVTQCEKCLWIPLLPAKNKHII